MGFLSYMVSPTCDTDGFHITYKLSGLCGDVGMYYITGLGVSKCKHNIIILVV